MNCKEDYWKLALYLQNSQLDEIILTFAQIEDIVEKKLPKSAFEHKSAWWGNDRNHTQCVWLDVGYTGHVDTAKEQIVFTRQKLRRL